MCDTLGGFDMIRSGRDKIEKPEEFQNSIKFCTQLKLDGLVIIGGDDSNILTIELPHNIKSNKLSF